jgi:ATP adenylyltransferase
MNHLWAPWRVEYIRSSKNGCIFCKSLKSNSPEKNLIIEKQETVFSIMNKYPYNCGHLMVAPIRHVGSLEELNDSEILGINRLLVRAQKALKMIMNPQGFNIGINQGEIAGAGVIGHIHIHLVPRWQGDTNFMPVLGSTKVVVEAINKTYHNIIQALKDIDNLR